MSSAIGLDFYDLELRAHHEHLRAARMLERVRELTAAERLANVSYELGDAQVYRFDTERFDLVISRFGTMFFSDAVAAFANVASALRPQGRLAALVWQRRERNEWALEIDAALGGAARAVDRLRRMLEDHHDDDRGVVVGSRSRLITGRRR